MTTLAQAPLAPPTGVAPAFSTVTGWRLHGFAFEGVFTFWRPRRESHPLDQFCRLVPHCSATRPRCFSCPASGVTCGSRTRSTSATGSRAPGTLKPPSERRMLVGRGGVEPRRPLHHLPIWLERPDSNRRDPGSGPGAWPLRYAPPNCPCPPSIWLERPDSNRRDPGSRPGAWPLRYAPNGPSFLLRLVGPRGFEPRFSEPKSDVLPLDDKPSNLERPMGLEPILRRWKRRVPPCTLRPRLLFGFGCRGRTRTSVS